MITVLNPVYVYYTTRKSYIKFKKLKDDLLWFLDSRTSEVRSALDPSAYKMPVGMTPTEEPEIFGNLGFLRKNKHISLRNTWQTIQHRTDS